jgi:phage terminase large subunit-like protein
MRLCFPGVTWKPHKQEGYIEFPNGSEIWIGGLDDQQRVEKILGMEFVTLYYNECSQIPYSSVLMARTRLAQQIEGLKPREYYDCNPPGTGHYTYQLWKEGRDPESGKPIDPAQYAEMSMNPGHNRANIADDYLDTLETLPEKQRRRFFEGEWSPDVEGALWTLDVLDRNRIEVVKGATLDTLLKGGIVPALKRVVVAVDPSGASGKEGERSDEIGIVVAGRGVDNKAYVLADRTLRAAPAEWAKVAVTAFDEFRADRIVAEQNYGGAMVEHTIKTERRMVPVTIVTASRGKAVRAEPVSSLYEQDSVRHVGRFPQLEEQMLNMSAAGYVGAKSPDRLDALVWALTDLMLGPQHAMKSAPLRL